MLRRLLALALPLAAACRGPAASTAGPAPEPRPLGRPPLRVAGPLSPRIASYRIDATLDAAAKRITASETLSWRNDGVAPVTTLPLHLYMNAFKNEGSIFLRESRGHHRRAERTDWGWIELSSIQDQRSGAELRPDARAGADETVLEVPLAEPVAPGETLLLAIAFTTQLPRAFARTGYHGDFVMAGQWFPKVGVLRVTGPATQAWDALPFHANSEFFADFGVYDVTLTVPATHVVAATGVLTRVETPTPGLRRLTYRAEDVHDFAWMADPHMQVTGGRTGDGVDVFVYHRPAQARFAGRHLEAARRALETYGRLFGPYPFAAMTVIDPPPGAAAGTGGMEYPTLVTTSGDSLLGGAVHLAETTTVHEVGHNWFQGMIASDEAHEAWLDEGVNEYATGLVLDEWFGPERSLGAALGLRLGYYDLEERSGARRASVPIATPSYEFPTFGEYAAATYSRTAAALKTLENIEGRDRFLAALGVYARRFAFRHPTGEDFIATLAAELGPRAGRFLEEALRTRGEVALRLVHARSRRAHPARGVFGEGGRRRTVDGRDAPAAADWETEVLVENTGEIEVPVEIEMRFADGTRERRTWDGRGGFHRLVLTRPARVVEVVVDPDARIRLQRDRLACSWRAARDRRAAWRAGARAAFWQQTLLQAVGL